MSKYKTIAALRSAYMQGETTPAQIVAECMASIRSQRESNAWIHVLDDAEVAPYVESLTNKRPEDCPLWGIPFAIKDNIDLAGIPTTAACPEFAYTPEKSAFVVQRLIDAGAIPLGKTNLDQFATGLVGTRSPYGEVPNAIVPSYVSGGSSSGSAWAVAKGQVCFALGTDTAGSGRVPAAFNGLVGIKPTKGRLSIDGVVPACKSLDCITFFAHEVSEAKVLLDIASAVNPKDPFSRSARFSKGLPGAGLRLGIPRPEQLQFFGNDEYATCFAIACDNLRAVGVELIEIDFAPFLATAKLLYQGPWVAERYAAVGAFIESASNAVSPVIREIILPGKHLSAVDAFQAQYDLQALKVSADSELAKVDAILTPTAGTCFTRASLAADPIALNSKLGTYTNFMNLLDYAALALPAGTTKLGLPFGVTVFAGAFHDERLLEIGNRVGKALSSPLNANNGSDLTSGGNAAGYITVAVCGAHLQGMPLNWQLTQRNAVFLQAVRSSAHYRFFALAGGPPFRPGMVRVSEGGGAIAMELWAVPEEHFGSFVAGIPAPLGIGKVETQDGRWVSGFICEAIGMEGATDITGLADWRAYIKSMQAS